MPTPESCDPSYALPAIPRTSADRLGRPPEAGPGDEEDLCPQVTPFRIEIPEAELEDLRERLRRTRWPEPETVEDWSQGIPLAYVQDLCRYGAQGGDWG